MSVSVLARAVLPADFVQRVNNLTDVMESNRAALNALWAQGTYSEADNERVSALLDENTELEEHLLGLLLAAGLQPDKLRKALS